MHPAKHPEITAGILSVSPIRKSVICTSSPSVSAAWGCVGWLQNTGTLKRDHWTTSINFPQCLLQKCTGRMKEQTADVQHIVQKGSWLLIPAIQCQSSLPCLTLQSAPIVEMLQRSNDGHSARAEKCRTKLRIISQQHCHSRILLSAWCCQSGIHVHLLDCSQQLLIRHQFTLKSRTHPQ